MCVGERCNRGDITGDVNERNNVNCKLAKNRTNDVGVENIGLWTFFGQGFDGLKVLLARRRDDRKLGDIPLHER